MYIVNLFGDGIRYRICDLDAPLWEPLIEYRLKHSTTWYDIIMDLTLLQKFGINDLSQLSNKKETVGILLNGQNRIEIKKGARHLERFRSIELNNSYTLFPKYKTDMKKSMKIPKRHLIIAQFETGLIGKYKIETPSMLIEELTFILDNPPLLEYCLLFTDLVYNGSKLKRLQADTVIRGVRILTI
jgi:hypothetical protein